MSSNVFLLINLGCEMLYVLEQRLRAHKVSASTYQTVLSDIVSILFNEKLLREVIDSGPTLWSVADMRLILDKIVCSSLMRMDATSMDKLWQLGTAVLRWQLHWNHNIVTLTTTHLDGITKLCQSQHISKANLIFQDIFHSLTPDRRVTIRNALVLWLNDHRTKVSLLMRLQLQRVDGSYCSPTESTACFFDNLGENIFSYVTSEENETETRDDNNYKDVAEINSLVCSVMAQQNRHKVQVKLPFLTINKSVDDPTEEQQKDSVGKVQVSENKPNHKPRLELFIETEPHNVRSLHDDLIHMLGD